MHRLFSLWSGMLLLVGCATAPQSGPLDARASLRPAENPRTQALAAKLLVLQRLIDVSPAGDPGLADLLFHRAELYATRQKDCESAAGGLKKQLQEAEQRSDDATAASLKRQEQGLKECAQQSVEAAARDYTTIVDTQRYRGYARRDEALFFLGLLLQQAQQQERARSIYQRLIDESPHTKYLPLVYLAMGEERFESGRFQEALPLYERVVELGDSPIYGYALYKKAWTHYNLKDLAAALAAFGAVIERPSPQVSPQSQARLAQEARRDLVRVFAEFEPPESAWPLFQKYGEKEAPVMLERLAKIYEERAQLSDSIAIYRQLLQLDPQSRARCAWQGAIVKHLEGLPEAGHAVLDAERERLSAMRASDVKLCQEIP
jgi:tetratricopeptide (TPR) repeat protein